MKIIPTSIAGVVILEPKVFGDQRGYFLETWSRERYREAGIDADFVQDNISFSTQGTLRGLHFQHPRGQGKLVQVLNGSVYDVAVDIRIGSATFGQWVGVELTAEKHNQLYIPPGFAHGFYVISDTAQFSYKCTDYYSPQTEGGILWSDPEIAINWPQNGQPILSDKDAQLGPLSAFPQDRLPTPEACV